MRTSNIILLALALVICATVTALAVTIRVKVDHHSYTKLIPAEGDLTEVPLGTFSIIAVDNLNDVNIEQGSENRIRLPKDKDRVPSYRLQGDTLKVWSEGRGTARFVVRDLRGLSLLHMGQCNLTGIKGDSLVIRADGNGSTSLDSCDLGGLRLSGSWGPIELTNSRFANLNIDTAGIVTLQNDHIGQIEGRWDEQGSLQIDAATLHNGIQKIERIQ
jgi:hypothetical protein